MSEDAFRASCSCNKPSAAEEAENEIERLNELGLGDDISYEEYCGYLQQLPDKADVDTSTKLDDVQLKERHALYRFKYYQLSQQVSEYRIRDYPPGGLVEERFFKRYEEDGRLDWSFHPDYCRLAGLHDYQRLIPRNYGGYEYNLMRGTYQAIKIATNFSTITPDLAYNELDGVYYEIWQRYTGNNGVKFRDALDEVYQLGRFPLQQDRMRSALENDTFCSDLEEEFLACTTCLKEFVEENAQTKEEKARELIAEALRKETQKPKFYEEYCRKKIDIARAIGLISS
ncbi:unnamed protein product [Alopecurus aequalis]